MRGSTLKLLHIFYFTNSRSILKPYLHLVPLHFKRSSLCSPCFETSSSGFGRLISSITASNSVATSNGNGNVSARPHPRRTYQVVVAATQDMGIGKDGKLPWRLPTDLKFFKEITMMTSDPGKKNAVLMGRKTWESIPVQNRPLPGRLNVILTHLRSFDIAKAESVVVCRSMSAALELLAASPYSVEVEKVFIIGGGQIFREALNAHGCECDAIHITEIGTSIECDTFIPPIKSSMFQPWYSSFPRVENDIRYSFTTYVRIWNSDAKSLNQNIDPSYNGRSDSIKFDNRKFSFLPKMIFERHEEYQYLRLLQEIITEGTSEEGGTGTGTLSKFGCQMRFNLRKTFPLLTTKKLSWKVVVGQLLSFISGSTNVKKGFHMLDDCRSREHLDSIGLTSMEEADLEPLCGNQRRHFGARYTNMHADYSGQGYDQLLDVINKIKNDPDNQEIILPLWSPDDLTLMAHFYVANGELSCQIYEQSADMGLWVPYGIASYALLACVIARVCELVAGDFIYVIGDAHVSHLRPLQEQLKNLPKPFPVLKINPKKKDIDSFVASDFELTGYDPHQKDRWLCRNLKFLFPL